MASLRRPVLLVLVLSLAACSGGGSGGSSKRKAGSGGSESGGSENGGSENGGGIPTTSMSAAEEAMALEVLDLVNAERAAQGEAPLLLHVEASQVAYEHSLDMDVRDFFAHTNPDDQSPGDRIAEAGIPHRGWGENIAWGYPDAQAVMDGWMNSPGHRSNILASGWTHVGIGVHAPGSGGPWWTQVFLRVP